MDQSLQVDSLQNAFRAWDDIHFFAVNGDGGFEGSCIGLEHAFDEVVGVFAVMGVDVGRDASVVGEGAEEFLGHLAVVAAKLGILERRGVEDEVGAAADVEVGRDEGFVHGNREAPVARDTFSVSQGFVDGFAQGNGGVLDDVVGVHASGLVVTMGLERDVKVAVEGKKGQHVVEKTDACGDVGLSCAVKAEGELDLGFFRVAGEG